MLTADLVRVRKRAGMIHVTELKGKSRLRALELAELYLSLAADQVGNTYEQLQEAWAAVEVGPREKKLADGLLKLIEDDCDFAAESPIEPRKLRGEVFLLASELRRSGEGHWDRNEILAQVAKKYEVEPEVIDGALYSDLRSQHRLNKASPMHAEQLLERYDFAQYQAVLLRAVQVVARVRCSQPAAYRQLFRTLKFRRLLHTIAPDGDGYRIEIDGPFSLFESVTKYGLQLAMAFPALCRCEHVELTASLRWGKQRERLDFAYEHKRPQAVGEALDELPEEVEQLRDGFAKLKSPWKVKPNEKIVQLDGVGMIVPDLAFTRGKQTILLEVLGFWSRDAVWKRVELVEAGVADKLLFAVSSRLRVSEAVLDNEQHGALYVYKGVMSAKAVLARLDALGG